MKVSSQTVTEGEIHQKSGGRLIYLSRLFRLILSQSVTVPYHLDPLKTSQSGLGLFLANNVHN